MFTDTFMHLAKISATYPQDDWGAVGVTVITGLVVVFLILMILVAVLWLMGKINSSLNKPKKKDEASAAPVEAPSQTAVTTEEAAEDDDDEIIAVISAAIAAYGASEGKTYRIANIKRRDKNSRSSWSTAGIIDNTRAFSDR